MAAHMLQTSLRREEVFSLTPADIKAFGSAMLMHQKFNDIYGRPMAHSDDGAKESSLKSLSFGDKQVTIVSLVPHDKFGVRLTHEAFQGLEQKLKRDIIVLVEDQLQSGWKNSLELSADRIAQGIVNRHTLTRGTSLTSLAHYQMVSRALELGETKQLDAADILGEIVLNTARSLAVRCRNLALGVDETLKRVRGLDTENNLLREIYAATDAFDLETADLMSLFKALPESKEEAELSPDSSDTPSTGHPGHIPNFSSFLSAHPQFREATFGMAVRCLAPHGEWPDIFTAVQKCHQTWEHRFDLDRLHRAAVGLFTYSQNAPSQDKSSAETKYLTKISEIIALARYQTLQDDLRILKYEPRNNILIVTDHEMGKFIPMLLSSIFRSNA